jgi:hypothetical protein
MGSWLRMLVLHSWRMVVVAYEVEGSTLPSPYSTCADRFTSSHVSDTFALDHCGRKASHPRVYKMLISHPYIHHDCRNRLGSVSVSARSIF